MSTNVKNILAGLRIKIFSDGADLDSISEAYQQKLVKGFTTNPTLMARAGVTNYLTFAKEVLRIVPDLPVSFEVFSDDFVEMRRQALLLADLAQNVYVKIPITNTRRGSACALIHELSHRGIKLNITAMMTLPQVRDVAAALHPDSSAFISVFAGRIADAGLDPLPVMREALEILKPLPKAELLWASPREALNIIQAEQMGCHIITVTPDLLAKAKNFGKDLNDFSLETVKMFYNDSVKSGFSL
ncbi:MAG: transaldolase [Verrucomicrobia bacterium]|nr:MAG: transaldolase [Verrucomicrobiota bacterium]